MRILHTSDWHLGRAFGPYSLESDQQAFTDWIIGQVGEQRIDLVVIAGDVFDRAVASNEAITHFRSVLTAIAAAGTQVAVITGNHDGADRVGAYHDLLDASGVYLRGGYTGVGEVLTLAFADGPLDLVLLPYLDPQAAPDDLGRAEESAAGEGEGEDVVEGAYERRRRRTHESVLRDAIDRAVPRLGSGRSVAVAHAFVAGGEQSDSERDLVVGGTAVVAADLFAPFSYTALGHLHRPQDVGGPTVRYSGTPLRYSFSEDHAKSVTIVDLAPDGTVSSEHIPVPIGRAVRTVTGRIDDLLAESEPGDADTFVRVILTDPGVVLDAKARLSRRWPTVVEIEQRPEGFAAGDGAGTDAVGRRSLSREELVVAFWQEATGGEPSEAERELLFRELNAVAEAVSA
ncbi:MAG: exonuclease SbcCD subunit D [Actinomycetota bacterium]